MDDLEERTPPAPLKRLAAVVAAKRKAKAWSQANLAEATNLSRDVIKRIEAGDGDARASALFRVLLALDASAEDLKRILYGQVGAKRVS